MTSKLAKSISHARRTVRNAAANREGEKQKQSSSEINSNRLNGMEWIDKQQRDIAAFDLGMSSSQLDSIL